VGDIHGNLYRLDLPVWLQTHTFIQLEERLSGMVITVISVIFLTQAVRWQAGIDILWLGVACRIVILGISAFLYQESKREK
jgi:uncharacterized membrane protein YqhA